MAEMNDELIAPCGMNCGICSRYLALKYDIRSKGISMAYCMGCRPRDRKCTVLKKRCELLEAGRVKYCFECDNFPCTDLKKLDSKYRSKYHMSMVDNLIEIKEQGIDRFITSQETKWRCPGCCGTICCHNGLCFNCDFDRLQHKKDKYKWEGK